MRMAPGAASWDTVGFAAPSACICWHIKLPVKCRNGIVLCIESYSVLEASAEKNLHLEATVVGLTSSPSSTSECCKERV